MKTNEDLFNVWREKYVDSFDEIDREYIQDCDIMSAFLAACEIKDKEIEILKKIKANRDEMVEMITEKNKEIEKLKEQLDKAKVLLCSFDEYRSASDRKETSKTDWHTYERVLYDAIRDYLKQLEQG